ncbi:serine hydrolase domain-containing protein [Catellatospora tritici]|uniref:serine hydrolase domain-containing protein n=1 Tax=Catellatospora tritici TaxID=2851566 RepID=UPI001C2D0F12|nr:serine hydrolase domain-containing protein [Catellatospora tritici]MBV1855225.1 beta-lactamase family protein [Catellatospora tritici]
MTDLTEAAAALAARCRTEPELAHTSSLLVARHGVEIAAYDLPADGLDTAVPTIASVTKSLLSTVAGWAWHDGLVRLDDTLGDLLGDRVPPARRDATMHHLLSMTSGAAGGMTGIDQIRELPSGWVDELLREPQTAPQGAVCCYDNGAAHLLAAVLHEVTGGLLGYAADRVLARVGCAEMIWPTDPEGVPYGFGDARLPPRALLRFGEAWRTGTAVPAAYRELAWTAHSPSGAPPDRAYGYLWWIADDGGVRTCVAAGWAGQCVLVTPDLALTIVTTGSPDRRREGFSRSALEEMALLVAAAAAA